MEFQFYAQMVDGQVLGRLFRHFLKKFPLIGQKFSYQNKVISANCLYSSTSTMKTPRKKCKTYR